MPSIGRMTRPISSRSRNPAVVRRARARSRALDQRVGAGRRAMHDVAYVIPPPFPPPLAGEGKGGWRHDRVHRIDHALGPIGRRSERLGRHQPARAVHQDGVRERAPDIDDDARPAKSHRTAASEGRNKTTPGKKIMMNMTAVFNAIIGTDALYTSIMLVPDGATAFITNSPKPKGGEIAAISMLSSMIAPNQLGERCSASMIGK